MRWWVVQKGQQVACSSGRAPGRRPETRRWAPGSTETMVVLPGGKAECCREANQKPRGAQWGKCSRSWEAHDCMYNERRDQRAKNPHGFLGPSSQHPRGVRHPASNTQYPALSTRQPCATQDRVGFCEGGLLTSAAQQCVMRRGVESRMPSGIGFGWAVTPQGGEERRHRWIRPQTFH